MKKRIGKSKFGILNCLALVLVIMAQLSRQKFDVFIMN